MLAERHWPQHPADRARLWPVSLLDGHRRHPGADAVDERKMSDHETVRDDRRIRLPCDPECRGWFGAERGDGGGGSE